MDRIYWQEENERLWKQAEESGVRVPVEPAVSDMPGATDEERENERLRRENQKIKEGLRWAESLGGESVPIDSGVSAKMTHTEGDESKLQARMIEELVRSTRDGWPRLSIELIAALPEHEQLLIRQHEEEMIAGSKMQLADICENCHIKPQFAKTYRVLRRDKRESLKQARAALGVPSQAFSDAYGAALIRSSDAINSYKLSLMAQHFRLRWGQPIENWAGTEDSAIDRAGCSILLLALGSAVAGAVSFVFILAQS